MAALILGNVLGVSEGFAGKAIQRSSSSAELDLDPQNLKYPQELIKLNEWSVFKDTLIYTKDINQLPAHSRAMRRLYPQKHFRISLGLNWGVNSLEKDMRNVIQSSGLPPWQIYNHTAMGFEYLDLSWRFSYHWIIGGGIMSNKRDMADAYYGNENMDYSYSVNMKDFRVYMEYAISPVNRFLRDRTELLVGGGLIISRPLADFYYYGPNPGTGYNSGYDSYGPNTIFGFQVRTSCHL